MISLALPAIALLVEKTAAYHRRSIVEIPVVTIERVAEGAADGRTEGTTNRDGGWDREPSRSARYQGRATGHGHANAGTHRAAKRGTRDHVPGPLKDDTTHHDRRFDAVLNLVNRALDATGGRRRIVEEDHVGEPTGDSQQKHRKNRDNDRGISGG
jgi:hypothetical protein